MLSSTSTSDIVYNSAYRLRFPAFGLRAAPLRAVRCGFRPRRGWATPSRRRRFDFFPILFPIRFPILGRGGLAGGLFGGGPRRLWRGLWRLRRGFRRLPGQYLLDLGGNLRDRRHAVERAQHALQLVIGDERRGLVPVCREAPVQHLGAVVIAQSPRPGPSWRRSGFRCVGSAHPRRPAVPRPHRGKGRARRACDQVRPPAAWYGGSRRE